MGDAPAPWRELRCNKILDRGRVCRRVYAEFRTDDVGWSQVRVQCRCGAYHVISMGSFEGRKRGDG